MTAHKVNVVSTTKDSIHIQWESTPDFPHFKDIRGYRIVYQAIGSSFKQEKLTGRYASRYDIQLLHESTFYNICVQSFANSTRFFDDVGCVRGSTHTESLSVAIGSTFGAFLALAFIVALVFLAKRQHSTMQTKKPPGDQGSDAAGVAIDEALIHMSDSLYIQLCRQRPDFAERLRDFNSESGLAGDAVTDDASRQGGTSQHDFTPASGGGGGGGGEVGGDEADPRTVEYPDQEDPMDDGLLKPPAIPGVFVRPKLVRTRSVQDSTPDLTDPATSSHATDEPEDDVRRT